MTAITLRQLRYFEALVRHRHFGQAARASAVSQPALSMQIRELEAAIGVPLVERRARRVEVTAAGVEVARAAEEILKSVAELAEIGHAHGRGQPGALTGRLTLGIIPTVAPYLLPALLARLAEAAPGLDLVVRESQTERLLGDLTAAQLDAALIAMPETRPGLVTLPLIGEPFMMLRRRAESALPAPQGIADVAMLEEVRLLLLEEGHCLRDQALSFCAAAGAEASETLNVSSLSTLAQMAEAGMGVTLIPAMAAPVEVRSDALECLSFGEGGPARVLGLAWRATSPLSDRFEALGAVIRAAAEAVLGDAALAPEGGARVA